MGRRFADCWQKPGAEPCVGLGRSAHSGSKPELGRPPQSGNLNWGRSTGDILGIVPIPRCP